MQSSRILESLAAQGISFDVGILAGGKATRMGGVDKGLQLHNGRALVEYSLEQLTTLTKSDIMISCNRNADQYARYSSRLCQDTEPGFKGPMAGLLSLLENCKKDFLLVFPCDTPQCSVSVAESLLLALLEQADEQRKIAAAFAIKNQYGPQPLHLLITTKILPRLRQALRNNEYKIVQWLDDIGTHWVNFNGDDVEFTNVNSAAQLNTQFSK